MLMRFDPFRELDRLTQTPWAGSRPTAGSGVTTCAGWASPPRSAGTGWAAPISRCRTSSMNGSTGARRLASGLRGVRRPNELRGHGQ